MLALFIVAALHVIVYFKIFCRIEMPATVCSISGHLSKFDLKKAPRFSETFFSSVEHLIKGSKLAKTLLYNFS